jgi:hypothetical protein
MRYTSIQATRFARWRGGSTSPAHSGSRIGGNRRENLGPHLEYLKGVTLMARVPRRRKNGKPAPALPLSQPETRPDSEPPPPKLCPADELEARVQDPDEGAFLHGLEKRIVYPTLVEEVTEAGMRIMRVIREHDDPALWSWYEDLECDLGFVRERAAFSMGWEHGSADGRAEFFRSQAPALSKKAKRLADQARALVVNGGLTPVEAAALLVETTWAVLLAKPTPPYDE